MKTLRRCDDFGRDVSLTYGDTSANKHQTPIGGIFSILAKTCFAVLVLFSFIDMFLYRNMKVNNLSINIGW